MDDANKIYTEDPQILGVTLQHVVAWVICERQLVKIAPYLFWSVPQPALIAICNSCINAKETLPLAERMCLWVISFNSTDRQCVLCDVWNEVCLFNSDEFILEIVKNVRLPTILQGQQQQQQQ
jgi:hypothetical protein